MKEGIFADIAIDDHGLLVARILERRDVGLYRHECISGQVVGKLRESSLRTSDNNFVFAE
jgi:hypothetical protein